MAYRQTARPLRIETPLGEDALLLQGYRGAEALSQPFSFTLDLLSEDPAVDPGGLLGKPVTVLTELPGGAARPVNGLVNRFGFVERREDVTAYRAEIVPWFWLLSLSQESRIFQHLSVLQIVEQVFGNLGFSDFEFRCTRSYEPREYCVQYRETHLAFVSRLLEEEGIFYFFEHTSQKHTLVIADGNHAFESVPGGSFRFVPQGGEHEEGEDVVREFVDEHAVHTTKVSLRDYDYLQPSFNLEAFIEGGGNGSGGGPIEVYDYPGSYVTKEEGDRYARLRLESKEAMRRIVRGGGTARAFTAGGKFELRDHPSRSSDGEYVVSSVTHSARSGDFRSWDEGAFDYRNTFECIPSDVPFRPLRVTPRPVVHGTQTAVVVGKAGEEIWTDSHGRIKVQFHWDREGKKDENSSCWIRVATPWAGKGWGAVSLPRIGQEVVVAYVEGDPDRPLIVGSVYNAEQTPPYGLPANQTQSGVKSRSSKGGSGSNFNEIRMEDKKGEEVLYIHAEKDQEIVVENDRGDSVGRDESRTIGRDQGENIERNRTITVGEDDTLTVGKDRKTDVGSNQSLTVGKDRTASVQDDDSTDIGKKRTVSIGADDALNVGGSRSTQIGADDSLDVEKKLSISAGDEIIIKTGKASITMKKDGSVKISGKDISIEGSGKINVKASGKVAVKGSQTTLN